MHYKEELSIFDETGISINCIENLKTSSLKFLKQCNISKNNFSLTIDGETTPYARCFAIFLARGTNYLDELKRKNPELENSIKQDLESYFERNKNKTDLSKSKPFLQLFAFSISALNTLSKKLHYDLLYLAEFVVPENIKDYLEEIGVSSGLAQTGNLSMLIAVISYFKLIHSDDKREYNNLSQWFKYHIENSNEFGFWGSDNFTYLSFQNGYHQYEIFDFFNIKKPRNLISARMTMKLQDGRGQYAPYFGGSGCYDYDAINIITNSNIELDNYVLNSIKRTATTIIREQNEDGGFSESKWIYPKNSNRLLKNLIGIVSTSRYGIIERAIYFINLFLKGRATVSTHWSQNDRNWGESNLWDTWVRLLTLASIDCKINKEKIKYWPFFLDYPGIGYKRKNI